MQLLNPYPFKLFLVSAIFFVLQSCADKPGSWKNDQISTSKRADFHALTADALTKLKANDAAGLRFSMSKELIDNHYTIRLIELISNQLQDHNFKLLDEYYVINKYKDADTINTTATGTNAYGLKYPGTAQEMYLAFFIPKESSNAYMISLTYAKFDYGWKISDLDVAPYKINGKIGPELYMQATKDYSESHLIDALDNASLAITCMRPGMNWNYPGEVKIHAFYDSLLTVANRDYKMPFILKDVGTRPAIFRIVPTEVNDGTYPMVSYLTGISLKDTVAVRRENDEIRKVIGKIMPGIDQNKKYVLYTAYNEKPNSRRSVEHSDFVEKLTK